MLDGRVIDLPPSAPPRPFAPLASRPSHTSSPACGIVCKFLIFFEHGRGSTGPLPACWSLIYQKSVEVAERMSQNEPDMAAGAGPDYSPTPPGREYRSQLTLLRRLENTSHLFSLVMSQCSHDPVLPVARLRRQANGPRKAATCRCYYSRWSTVYPSVPDPEGTPTPGVNDTC